MYLSAKEFDRFFTLYVGKNFSHYFKLPEPEKGSKFETLIYLLSPIIESFPHDATRESLTNGTAIDFEETAEGTLYMMAEDIAMLTGDGPDEFNSEEIDRIAALQLELALLMIPTLEVIAMERMADNFQDVDLDSELMRLIEQSEGK